MKSYEQLISELKTKSYKVKPGDTVSADKDKYAVSGEVSDLVPDETPGGVKSKSSGGNTQLKGRTGTGEKSVVQQGTPKLKDQSGFKGQSPTRRGDQRVGDLKVVRPIKESYGEDAKIAYPSNYGEDTFDPKKHHVFSLTNKSPYSSTTQYFHAEEGKDALRKSHRIDPYGDPKIAHHKPGTPEYNDYAKAQASSAASRKSMDVETIKSLVARHGIKHKGKPLNPKAIHEKKE